MDTDKKEKPRTTQTGHVVWFVILSCGFSKAGMINKINCCMLNIGLSCIYIKILILITYVTQREVLDTLKRLNDHRLKAVGFLAAESRGLS
jgi:hypothetical protein